jgi:hypothetical protein
MKRSGIWLALAAMLVVGMMGCQQPTQPVETKSSEKSITAFSFTKALNAGLDHDYAATWNAISGKFVVGPMTYGNNASNLIATFALSDGATATIGSAAQQSGVTANSFTSDVVYTVTAPDGSTANYTVSVSVDSASTGCTISAFGVSIGGTAYAGTINETATPPTVDVYVPYGSDVTNLAPTFTASANSAVTVSGAGQTSGSSTQDFSTGALSYLVMAQDGTTTKTYTVTVHVLEQEKLMFTEYCEGLSNNKYLEITNTGSTDIDLSAYTITEVCHNSSNVATPTSNVVEALSGTLAAGKSVVYANYSFSTTTFTVLNTLGTTASVGSSWKKVEPDSSNITYFNGNDPLVLAHSGVEVDRIGPADHSNFAADTLLVRKLGMTPSATFNAADWNSFAFGTANAVGDDWSAGTYTAVAGNTIRIFAINGVRGTISGTSIAITLPTSTAVTALAPTFIADAASVQVSGADQVSGTSTQDFTSPVTYIVSDGTTPVTYTVTVTLLNPIVYTNTNYTFSGGIQTARTLIGTNATGVCLDGTTTYAAPTASGAVGADVTLTGIVTAIMAGGNKVYIQDQDTAICLFAQTSAFTGTFPGGNFKVGDKISVTNCRTGVYYNGLLEVSGYSTTTGTTAAKRGYPIVTVLSSDNAVYYKEGDWSSDASLSVYKYTGAISTIPASTNSYIGTFDSDTTKRFTTITGGITVTSGQSGTFYGVVDVTKKSAASSDGTIPAGTYYVLTLVTSDQIR